MDRESVFICYYKYFDTYLDYKALTDIRINFFCRTKTIIEDVMWDTHTILSGNKNTMNVGVSGRKGIILLINK